jgi:GntR family transcriptional regulator
MCGKKLRALRSGDSIDASMNSTMALVKVNRGEPSLLHEQVAAQIRRAIADGEAKPGERLPPARDLAAVMDVNTNTVLRALHKLRDEGLLEFRRGHGVRVVGTSQSGLLLEKAIELVDLGRRHGYPRDELLRMIRSLP